VVVNALAQLGLATATRTKDAGFCDFQTKVMEERILYWSEVALDSGDHQVDGEIPYVFCGSGLPGLPEGAGSGQPVTVTPPDSVQCTDQQTTLQIDGTAPGESGVETGKCDA
jgi:hypothetical protein